MSLSRQQFTLLGIFALFLGPLLLVMMMRSSWWQYQPEGMKNMGFLVTPPTALPLNQTDGIEGKWSILYILDDPCEQTCLDNVTALRQIHRAVGRHAEHLVIVLLSERVSDAELQAKLATIYPQFKLVADFQNVARNVLSGISSKVTAGSSDSAEIQTYILDPMLNVILAYDAGVKPGDLHKDLKRLLKWSDQEK